MEGASADSSSMTLSKVPSDQVQDKPHSLRQEPPASFLTVPFAKFPTYFFLASDYDPSAIPLFISTFTSTRRFNSRPAASLFVAAG
jgi:hypothetical protein